jgi:hypothetical protein
MRPVYPFPDSNPFRLVNLPFNNVGQIDKIIKDGEKLLLRRMCRSKN